MKKSWFFLLAVIMLAGCKKKTCKDEQDISGIDLTVSIESLENELYQISDTTELASFLDDNPVITREFFNDLSYPNREVMLEEVYKLIKNPYTDTLYQQVKGVFGNGEVLKTEFEDAFKRIKYYYPEFEAPRIQTVVTGFQNDVYLTDSLIVIGLDFYLGDNSKYKPDLFQYLLDRMTPDHLVPTIIWAMSNRFNKTDMSQRTMLDEMIFYGKSYHFTKKVMPCISDTLIAGYTGQELADSQVSESYIWSYFVENSLIYEKSTLQIQKFVHDRPSIPEIDQKCPGRIGRWLGWRMVQQFEDRAEEDFVKLMETTDARDILVRSKYRPQSR